METKPSIQVIDLRPNPKQEKAFLSKARIVLCCSGIQGGKSLVGALKLRLATYEEWPADKYPNVSFVVAAPDYKSLMQSTRQAFDLVFQGAGKMHDMKQEFHLYDGRKIFFRTMVKNPNSVEGIPNCVFIWGDEAAQYPRMAFINMQARTAFMRGQLFLTTTPYAMNWPKKEIIDRWKMGDPDIEYYEWLSIENPAFPKEEFERQKALLSKKEFERKYMGLHTRMEGLVFEDFGRENWVSPEDVDLSRAEYYGGIDWGFDHPLGLSIRAINHHQECYGVSFFKKSGLSVSQQLDLIEAKTKVFHVKHWSCGADRPEMTTELNSRGIPAFKYFEYEPEYREINPGNAKHAELIRTKQYRILTNAPQREDLEDEYETYSWDRKEGYESEKEKPKNIDDDLMSAERYCTIGTLRYLDKKMEKFETPIDYYQKKDLWTPTQVEKDWDSD